MRSPGTILSILFSRIVSTEPSFLISSTWQILRSIQTDFAPSVLDAGYLRPSPHTTTVISCPTGSTSQVMPQPPRYLPAAAESFVIE